MRVIAVKDDREKVFLKHRLGRDATTVRINDGLTLHCFFLDTAQEITYDDVSDQLSTSVDIEEYRPIIESMYPDKYDTLFIESLSFNTESFPFASICLLCDLGMDISFLEQDNNITITGPVSMWKQFTNEQVDGRSIICDYCPDNANESCKIMTKRDLS